MYYLWRCISLWQVVATFQRMRQEQRSMASKAAELEMDINEHRLVAHVQPLQRLWITVISFTSDQETHVLPVSSNWATMEACMSFTCSLSTPNCVIWYTECFLKFLFFPFSLVIDTLKDVDPSRKCFRLVGGVLVERTVKEVLPALENNKKQVKFEEKNVLILAGGRAGTSKHIKHPTHPGFWLTYSSSSSFFFPHRSPK